MSVTLKTPFCKLMGIQYPIVQAPVGSVSCPQLAAAVSNAGGLGMLALSWRSPEEIEKTLCETEALTLKPYGVNFVLDPTVIAAKPLPERLSVCLKHSVALVSFAWGKLTKALVDQVHHAGKRVAYTVWSAEQAKEALQAGADVLVVQGTEAGGHVKTTTSLKTLLPSVVAVAGDTPVLAAGGIADGQDMAKALQAGAQGVWMGTRFVASQESQAHPEYQQNIIQAMPTDTAFSTVFNGGWPDTPHRTLKNSTYQACQNLLPGVPRPGEGDVVATLATGQKILRYDDTPPLKGMTGDVEAMAQYAGTSVGKIQAVLPAAEIIQQLVNTCKSRLS